MKTLGVILGHARSGSSELSRAVSDASGEPFLMEPFHKAMKKRGVDFESSGFPAFLDEVMGKRLIKHMWNGLTPEQNSTILTHENIHGIVFIYRKDVVSAALSTVVAKMTKTWRGSAESISKPLPLREIEKLAKMYSEGQSYYTEWLEKNNINHIAVAYEDIFVEDAACREKTIELACEVLGLPANNICSGSERLKPDNRYNSDDFYRTAPNWDDFSKKFLS